MQDRKISLIVCQMLRKWCSLGQEKQFSCFCQAGAVSMNLFGYSIIDLYQMGWRVGMLAGHAVKDKSAPGIFLPKEKLSNVI